jgi:hypothetical protein
MKANLASNIINDFESALDEEYVVPKHSIPQRKVLTTDNEAHLDGESSSKTQAHHATA